MAFPDDRAWKCRLPIDTSAATGLVSGVCDKMLVAITEAHLPAQMLTDGDTDACQSDGHDVAFSLDEFGVTRLASWRRIFVPNATPSLAVCVWVLCLDLEEDIPAEIYVWWKTLATETELAVTDPYGRNAVFDSSGFDATFVMPLDEDPGGSAPQFADVTGLGGDGTVTGSVVRTASTGPLGVPGVRGSATGAYIEVDYPAQSASAWSTLWWTGLPSTSNATLFTAMTSAPALIGFATYASANFRYVALGGGDFSLFTAAAGHFGYVYNGTLLKTYNNGAEVYSTSHTSSAAASTPLTRLLNNYYASNRFWDSDVSDMIRTDRALTGSWMSTYYAIWTDPTDLITADTPEATEVTRYVTFTGCPAGTDCYLYQLDELGGDIIDTFDSVEDGSGDVVLEYQVTTTVPARVSAYNKDRKPHVYYDTTLGVDGGEVPVFALFRVERDYRNPA